MKTFLILMVAFAVFFGFDTYIYVRSGALSFRKRWRWLLSKKNKDV